MDNQEKPVFLTKKQREQLALERLQTQRDAQAMAIAEAEHKRKEYLRIAAEKREKGVSRDEEVTGKRRKKEEEVEMEEDVDVSGLELQMIKDQYLGSKKKKKKLAAFGQKSRFVFDWGEEEDTSSDLNPLYNNKHEVSLAFGRGYLGGIDQEEQREKSSKLYGDILLKRNVDLERLKDQERVKERMEKSKVKEKVIQSKSRHWTEKKLEEMTERDWRIFNEDFNITTRGGSIPKPLRSWKEGNFPPALYKTLIESGYDNPTPIQRAAIPIGIQNRDLMGIAETGSGKTVAFVIPMLLYILQRPKMTPEIATDGPYALVLAPTRELVQQIHAEVQRLSKNLGIRSVMFIGGTAQENQGFMIQGGAEIVIATPGRMVSNVKKKYIVLNQCNYIVLDEADRMIEMNFEDQVVELMDSMPSSNIRPENPEEEAENYVYRQTIMFSATMPVKVELLARKYLRNPAYVSIGERTGSVVEKIQQNVLWTTESQKLRHLRDVIHNEDPPIIVFCNAKKTCDVVARFLISEGYSCAVLHSGKSQDLRGQSLEGFKKGTYDVLVATDVAGRGLDIRGVTHVVNYDMPKTMEGYTHRIGRTGRAGLEGRATSLLTNEDTDIMYDLKQMLIQTESQIPPELARHEAALVKPGTVSAKPKSEVIFAK